MKKIHWIVFVLAVTSIVLIFSKGIKAYVNPFLNKNVYNFLEDEGNRRDINDIAIKLNQGSSANTCVYFIAEVLRRNNFKVPAETSDTSELISLLTKKGLKKQTNYKKLMPGDICFTTDGNGDVDGVPTHTYIFMKWVKDGSYDYAYICDDQAKDYKDKVYHIRNINVVTRSNGFDKEAFAFFMK